MSGDMPVASIDQIRSKPDTSKFHRQSSDLTFVASNCGVMRHPLEDAPPQDAGNASFDETTDGIQSSRMPLHLTAHEGSERDNYPDGANDFPHNVRFYRVVFKGVVALLDSPHADASRNGSYLSYGEIFCAQNDESLEEKKTNAADRDDTKVAVRVTSLLTGGYTLDVLHTVNSGYLFLEQNNIVVAESLHSTPRIETGMYHYQVISTTPLPILTGPAIDAPRTKAVVMPKSVQEVSVRVQVDTNASDSEIWFLRLSHRRGWISDRRTVQRSQSSVPVVKQMCYDWSDVHSSDGSSSIVSGSTYTSAPKPTRHRPPRRRRDASTKDGDKGQQLQQRLLLTGKSHLLVGHSAANGRQSQDTTEASVAPSSNVSMLSDDSSHTHPSLKTTHLTQPSTLDSSFATARSTSTRAGYHQVNDGKPTASNYYLMRVTAPRGLKILDAPQFQVSRLIRGAKQVNPVSSSHMVSQIESGPKLHHSIFQTMSGRLTTTGPSQSGNPSVFDIHSKSRVLPFGVLFEASTRMETTGSYSQGAGLVKLSDSSGWAIVPSPRELEQQHHTYSVGATIAQSEATSAFSEVGSAQVLHSRDTTDNSLSDRSTIWFRVMSRSGLTVSCPPPILPENDDVTSPTSSRDSSAVNGSNCESNAGHYPSNESDVASSVGSAFLDALFRTPRNKDSNIVKETLPRPHLDKNVQANTIPCGTFVEVDRWAEAAPKSGSSREYARLCGGQGWVPLSLGGKPLTARVAKPEFQFGSFWYRVQSSRGLKVRLGPSTRAPSIKSDDGMYFRFECGEFLRASEVVTAFTEQGEPTESFAKLYRNRHVRLDLGHDDFRPLASLTAQSEWVQIYGDNELYLEECGAEPRIERHKQGWRYNVVPEEGVPVRKGPSFAAAKTGVILFGGESVLVNERVSPSGETITWLRLKDGQGWVHDVDSNGESIVIAHSLRHRAQGSRPRKPATPREGSDRAYNDIIARLFHNDDLYQQRKGDVLQR